MPYKQRKKINTASVAILFICLFAVIAFFIVILIHDSKTTPAQTVSIISSQQTSKNADVSSETSSQNESSAPADKPLSSISYLPREEYIPPPPYAKPFTDEDKKAIDDVVEKYGAGVSVYYEDIYSQNVYTYNDQEKYYMASIIKAPYCMYLYQLASDKKLDLNKTLTFEKKHIQEGTGKLKEVDVETLPMQISIRDLISHAIIESDNTAMDILLDSYPYQGYTKYAMSLGLKNESDIKYVVNGDICATDAGVYIKAIYHFIETNPYGLELKNDMMKTGNRMITSKNPIARKYGWADLSFHDMAIVYAKNPYVLVILTNHDNGKKEDYQLFADITQVIESRQALRNAEIAE